MLAVAAVGLALLLSALLRPLVEPNPFLLVFVAITLSAGYGGLGPGLLAAALAVIGVNYLLIAPASMLKLAPLDLVRLGVFALAAALVSGYSSAGRRAELAARARLAAEKELRFEAEQRARERLAFLAEASTELAASLDYAATLGRLARLCVPRLADWCVVDTLAEDGTIIMQILAHVDPARVRWGREMRERYTLSIDQPGGAAQVIRTGEPLLVSEVTDAMLQQAARDEEELRLLRAVGYRSVMVVPLRANERVIGALGFVVAEAERRYTPDDVTLAVELARRAGAALDHARLYQAAQAELALRQQAEIALRDGEAQLRLIADALPVLISYLGSDQHYRFNNRAYEEWFGEERARVTGRHIREVVGEAAYERLRPHLEAALAGELVSFETLTPYRTGGTRHIHATYVPDRGEDGAVRGAVVLVEDISARKRAEEGQRLLVAAGVVLASSLEQGATLRQVARLMLPALADFTIICLSRPDGRITRIASAHVDPEQEPLLTALERDYPLDPSSDAPVARVLRDGRLIVGESFSDELLGRIARDAAHLRLLRALGMHAFLAVPMRARGRTLGAILLVATSPARQYSAEDVALAEELAYRAALAIDNANLYQATQEARDSAEEAVTVRDRFLSVASHELKTPLTSLLLQTQLLQRRAARAALLPEREQKALQVIAGQAQRLDRMIAALLDISRLELGQLSLSRAPLDLCALARRVVAEVEPTTEAHTLTCTAPEAPLLVDGDELRLEQVLQNLLQNAIKYSPDGGPVTVGVEARSGQVCLSVSDRGLGIPDEALPRLFERFYRAPNADPRQISGLGIGLYVVREIVRLHGGSVQAERQAHGGSLFTVCLPRAGEADLAAPGQDALARDERGGP